MLLSRKLKPWKFVCQVLHLIAFTIMHGTRRNRWVCSNGCKSILETSCKSYPVYLWGTGAAGCLTRLFAADKTIYCSVFLFEKKKIKCRFHRFWRTKAAYAQKKLCQWIRTLPSTPRKKSCVTRCRWVGRAPWQEQGARFCLGETRSEIGRWGGPRQIQFATWGFPWVLCVIS